MAIIGGAGNPIGGSFTGPAEALEIVGEHAYAYSGLRASSTTAANHLNFTSGNFVFVGRVYFNGSITSDFASGTASIANILFNGVNIARLRTMTASDDQPSTVYNDIIIPAYTQVAVNVDSDSTGDGDTSVVLVGKIYRV